MANLANRRQVLAAQLLEELNLELRSLEGKIQRVRDQVAAAEQLASTMKCDDVLHPFADGAMVSQTVDFVNLIWPLSLV